MSIEPERTEDSRMSEAVVSSESGDEAPSRRELAERLSQLEAEKDAKIERLESRVEELEGKVSEQPSVEFEDPTDFKTLKVGGLPIGRIIASKVAKSELEAAGEGGKNLLEWYEELEDIGLENILEIDQRITNEQKTRSQQDGKIRREINKLAEEVGVDLQDVEVSGEDKIQRLIAHGPDDIVDRVYPVHERAREVLLHAGEWGRTVEDQFGKRITFTAPTVRQELQRELKIQNLQSKQVRDVFEKVVELSEDSPRKARVGKTDDGNTKMMIHLQQEEM